MSVRTRAIFLSYVSEDAGAARRLADGLRAAGLQVWFDQSELRGGDAWDRHIRKQIHDCGLFIAMISAQTEARSEGYFRREWRLAVDRTQDMADDEPFLLPVVIDGTPEASARVPEKFRDVQWTHLPGGEAASGFIERVSSLLLRAEQRPTAPVPPKPGLVPAAAATASARPRISSRSWPVILALLAVISAAVAYVPADKHGLLSNARGTSNAVSNVAASAIGENSIAVLPFADLSEKGDQGYLADGIAEEILDVLAGVPGLSVIARTSSFQFKGRNEEPRRIGQSLGAAHFVEGSVRRAGSHIRVTAQLIRSADGRREWSDSYDRNIQDVLETEREIATAVSRALQLSLGADPQALSGPLSPEAYELFLRGKQAFNRGDRAGLEEAGNDFQRVLELEPSFMRAQEEWVVTLFLQADNGFVPGRIGFERAREQVQRLLRAHPDSAIGHGILSRIYADYDWDWEAARQEVAAALRAAAREPHGLYTAAILATNLGQWDEAERMFRLLLSTDPLSPDLHQLLGTVLCATDRFEEAVAEDRRAIQISPRFPFVHSDLAINLLALGRPEDALRELQLESADSGRLSGLAAVYYALGRKPDSDASLKQLTLTGAENKPYEIAYAHASRGESAQALDWLERAYRTRDYQLAYIKSQWLLRGLRSDARYQAVLRDMKLQE